MLQQNPKGPRELPPTLEFLEKSAQEAIDARYEKFIRRQRRMITVGKCAVMAGLFFNASTATYLSDVRQNMIDTAEAKPSILHIGEAPDSTEQKANIYFDGFNTFGANNLVNSLGEGYQNAYGGENWSIQYNNAPLDSAELTEITLEKLEAESVRVVDYFSYSMGDDPMMDVATNTVVNTDIRVEEVNLVAAPADFDTLTEKTKDELALAKNLAWIPWIEYSTPFRYVLETYFYRANIEKNAWAAFNGINTRFSNGNVTTNSFLASQIESISELNVVEKIEEIAQYKDTKHMPAFNVYTIEESENSTKDNKGNVIDSTDAVVDNQRAAEKICNAVFKAGLQCNIRSVKSVHSGYYFTDSIEQYNEAFANLAPVSQVYTEREIARLALIRYGQLQHWQHILGIPENESILSPQPKCLEESYQATSESTRQLFPCTT